MLASWALDTWLVGDGCNSVGGKPMREETAPPPLEVIEVQLGSYLGEDDIVRADDVYNRTPDETKH